MCIKSILEMFKRPPSLPEVPRTQPIIVPEPIPEPPRPQSIYLELSEVEQAALKATLNSLLGIKYVFGQEVKMTDTADMIRAKGIDCSELVEWAYYQLGFRVPDGSYNQYDCSKESLGAFLAGDLVFMRKKSDKEIGHVGVYVGAGMVVDANGYYGKVVCRPLVEFQKETGRSTYAGCRRLLVANIKSIKTA